MERSTKYWLIGIFVFTLVVRLILAFLIPNLTYDSYFDLRQVQNIHDTGIPLYNDPLSYGGREYFFLPFFHYLMAGFSFLLPLELVAKLLPNILLASLTIIVFLIARKITGNDRASLISAGIAGFLPALFLTNNFSVETLLLPGLFFAIYCFMNITNPTYLNLYLLSFVFLSLTSPATVLLIIGLGLYLLLSYTENNKIKIEEKEVLLFSLFLYLWIQLLFFKKIFISEGINFVWQNIPSQILLEYLPHLSVIKAIGMISVIPFLVGIIVVYRSLFKVKNRHIYLLISLVIAATSLSWLRVIRFEISLTFFGITLSILFASFYQDLIQYVEKTKVIWIRKFLLLITLSLLALTMLPLSFSTAWTQITPTNSEINAFKWLAQNTPPGSGVASLLEEGGLVTYYGNRVNVMDQQFTFVPNIEKRFNDLHALYNTKFQTVALRSLDQYGLQYLMLTPTAKNKYQIRNFNYLTPECFKKVYDDQVKIYLVRCSLKERSLNE
ncbi:MAG: hypothetical protein WCV90_03800 [Candidatus Woesearchaeota archaeon]|jgi:hypothetical protein